MTIENKIVFVYRCDIHPNIFAVALQNTEDGGMFFYSISNEHDESNSIAYIFGSSQSNNSAILCGYGNSEYDDIALRYIIEHHQETVRAFDIYIAVKEYLESKEHNNNQQRLFFSLDLKKILLPEKQRLSFEQVAFSLGLSIKDYCPMYEPLPNFNIKYKQRLKYETDVIAKVLNICQKKIQIRFGIYKKFKINALDVDDTLMGIRYFTRQYLDKTGESFDSFTSKRTPSQRLEVEKYCHICNENPGPLKDLALDIIKQSLLPTDVYNKTIVYNDIVLSAGSGGVRTIDAPKRTLCLGRGEIIVYLDFSSMFPKTMVNNNLFPRHLSDDFRELYNDILNKRLDAKYNGHLGEAEFYKGVLNAAIGLMNAEWSYMYDPAMFMAIRIQAMLYTLGFLEKVAEIANKIIQVNVDGIFIRTYESMSEKLNQIILKYQELHKLHIQKERYNFIYQHTTNDYIAYMTDGKRIGKGLFSDEPLQRVLRPKVVIDAATRYLINGTPIERTIDQYQDPKGFLLSINVGSNFKITHGQQNCGNSVRYFYSKNSMAPFLMRGNTIIDSVGGVEVVNYIDTRKIMDFVDRQKYYPIARKIVFNDPQQTLF